MSDERSYQPGDPPDHQPDAAPGDTGEHDGANATFSRLPAGKSRALSQEERDVSNVYITRNTTYYAAPGGEPYSAGRHSRTIGGLVVSALAADEVAAVQATFTPPTPFDAAERQFRTWGLAILHGPVQSGKRAGAIRLLSAIHFENAGLPAIYAINPDLRLTDLDPASLPSKTALLLESPDGAAFQGVAAFHWNALRASLKDRECGLVISVERLPEAVAAAVHGDAVAWHATWLGDRTAVQWNILERHLTHLIRQEGSSPETLADHLGQWRDEPRLAALLAQPLAPCQVADLAAALLPVLAGACTLDDALARQDAQVAEAVRAWFAGPEHALDLKTLLVAAAVFNGALADEVDQAADALQRALAPPVKRETPPEPADPFAGGATRSARYRQIGASLVATQIQGMHYGSTSGHALQLDHRAWQKAVLDHLWSEYSALREPLLAWLERYALEGSPRQRVRASAAIGALARLNFPLIEARILRQWANSHDANARRAAGQVLGIAMWDEQHSAAATGLLRHWAAADNWRLRWSAATACGGMAGERNLAATLDILQSVAAACVEQPQLLPPVTDAVLKLYLAVRGSPERRGAIVAALRGWCEAPAAAAKDARARAFALRRTAVFCCWTLLWPAPDDPAWRQLLADMALPGAPVQADGVALLRAGFNFRQPAGSVRDNLHPRKVGEEGLAALVRAIGEAGDADLVEHGAGLFHALAEACRRADAAQGSEERPRLQYFAAGWEKLPPAAEELRQILL